MLCGVWFGKDGVGGNSVPVGVRWGVVGKEGGGVLQGLGRMWLNETGGGGTGDGGSVVVRWGMVGREGDGRGEMEVL